MSQCTTGPARERKVWSRAPMVPNGRNQTSAKSIPIRRLPGDSEPPGILNAVVPRVGKEVHSKGLWGGEGHSGKGLKLVRVFVDHERRDQLEPGGFRINSSSFVDFLGVASRPPQERFLRSEKWRKLQLDNEEKSLRLTGNIRVILVISPSGSNSLKVERKKRQKIARRNWKGGFVSSFQIYFSTRKRTIYWHMLGRNNGWLKPEIAVGDWWIHSKEHVMQE